MKIILHSIFALFITVCFPLHGETGADSIVVEVLAFSGLSNPRYETTSGKVELQIIKALSKAIHVDSVEAAIESSNSFDKTGFSGIRIFVPESKITSKVSSGYYYITRDDPLVKALLDYGVKEKGLDVILPID